MRNDQRTLADALAAADAAAEDADFRTSLELRCEVFSSADRYDAHLARAIGAARTVTERRKQAVRLVASARQRLAVAYEIEKEVMRQ